MNAVSEVAVAKAVAEAGAIGSLVGLVSRGFSDAANDAAGLLWVLTRSGIDNMVAIVEAGAIVAHRSVGAAAEATSRSAEAGGKTATPTTTSSDRGRIIIAAIL